MIFFFFFFFGQKVNIFFTLEKFFKNRILYINQLLNFPQQAKIGCLSNDAVKRRMKEYSKSMHSGPWRGTWILNDFNPFLYPKTRFYQTLEIRLKDKVGEYIEKQKNFNEISIIDDSKKKKKLRKIVEIVENSPLPSSSPPPLSPPSSSQQSLPVIENNNLNSSPSNSQPKIESG